MDKSVRRFCQSNFLRILGHSVYAVHSSDRPSQVGAVTTAMHVGSRKQRHLSGLFKYEVEVHNGQEGRGWAKVDIGGGHGALEAKEDYQQQGEGEE